MQARGNTIAIIGLSLAAIAGAVAVWQKVSGGPAYLLALAAAIVGALLALFDRLEKIADRKRQSRLAERKATRLLSATHADLERDFNVHRSVAPDQPYVFRGIEATVQEALIGGQAVLIIGRSLAGKSRLAAEVIRNDPRLAKKRVYVLNHGNALADLSAADLSIKNAVVWINRLDTFLGESTRLTVQHLQTLKENGSAVIATMEHTQYDSFRPSGNVQSEPWQVLQAFVRVVLPSDQPATRSRLAESISDARLRDGVARYGLGEYLGAGAAAQSRFADMRDAHPRAYALVRAAIDWRRSLVGDEIPVETARALVPAYMDGLGLVDTDEPQSQAEEWAEAWATNGHVVRLLTRSTDGESWSPFDYLTQVVEDGPEAERQILDPTWDAVANTSAPDESLFNAGVLAAATGKTDAAIALFRRIDHLPDASYNLSVLLAASDIDAERVEGRNALERAARAGQNEAMLRYGLSLVEDESRDSARGVEWLEKSATAGNTQAMIAVASLLFNTHSPANLDRAREWWEAAAAAGEPVGLIGLAFQLSSSGKPEDLAESRDLMRRAAEAGRTDAMIALAEWLQDGAVESDRREATAWWTRAAKTGNLRAMLEVARHLGKSSDVNDMAQAVTWLIQAVAMGSIEALEDLATILNRSDNDAHRQEAIKLWVSAAEAGHVPAMTNLGVTLSSQDRETARYWLDKAAREGHAPAMASLGALLAREGDREEALHWLEAAANEGIPAAMFNVGVLLQHDFWREARYWFTQAANAGYPEAELALGTVLGADATDDERSEARASLTGLAEAGNADAMKALYMTLSTSDTQPDRLEARNWLITAAKAGDATAMVNLGALLYESDDVGQCNEALEWWTRAAEHGEVVAMSNLGVALSEVDRARAIVWFTRAASRGYTPAMRSLTSMLKDGRSVERTEAVYWAIKASQAEGDNRTASRDREWRSLSYLLFKFRARLLVWLYDKRFTAYSVGPLADGEILKSSRIR